MSSADASLEAGREEYGPITEVVVTQAENGDAERLYVGHITGVSMLKTWYEDDGTKRNIRYEIVDRVATPEPMGLEEVLEWVESTPDELNDALDNDLETDLGKLIGFTEFYPREDADGE